MRFKRTVQVVATVGILLATLLAPAAARALSCADGGRCRVGDIGPGGGRVFYDAGSVQWWGRYLEARPLDADGVPWSSRPLEAVYEGETATVLRRRVDAKAIGMGLSLIHI